MCKIKISNKAGTRSITVRIAEAADAKKIMEILSKYDYPFVLFGDDGKEEE